MAGYVDNNEGLICDAVVRFLEEKTGHKPTDLSHPELEGVLGGVDLLFNLRDNQYAIEHTKTEPFPNQIKFGIHFCQFIQPVIEKVRDCGLPKPGQYNLLLPPDVHVDTKAKRLRELQSSLIRWVLDSAQELHAKHPKRLSRDVCPAGHHDQKTARLDGFHYDISLRRSVRWNDLENYDGYLFPDFILPENMKDEQRNRIKIAIDKKKEKLTFRKRLGARSVLVLENNHFTLVSCAEIGNCLEKLLPNRPCWLDELFYMEAAKTPWDLYRWNWDYANWHYVSKSFDPDCLDDICAKPVR